MRSRTRHLYIFSLAFVFLSCGGNKNSEQFISQHPNYVVNCDLDRSNVITNLSQVCDSIAIIPLDFNSDLIGIVDKLCSDSTGIYIVSNSILYHFNWNGEQSYSIKRIGRSSSDYLELSDFCVSDNHIAIADIVGQKILLFNKLNGVFHKTINVDYYPENIEFLNNDTLAIKCSGSEGARLRTIDINSGKIIDTFFEFEQLFTEPVVQPFIKLGDRVHYKIPFYNDYYSISVNGKLEKSLSFDFGKYNFDITGLDEVSFFGTTMLFDTKGSAKILDVYNTDSLYAISLQCPSVSEDAQYLMFVDTKSDECYYFDSDTYIDDVLFYDHTILPILFNSYNGSFIGVIYPDLWVNTFNSITDKRKQSELYSTALDYYNCFSNNQNPLIVQYYFKLE